MILLKQSNKLLVFALNSLFLSQTENTENDFSTQMEITQYVIGFTKTAKRASNLQ